MHNSGPIIIGGTGRSGTTLLQQIIGQHPDILSIPFESRFIIDTGGILDIVYHLSDSWTPVNGDIAISRFSKLMLKDLNSKFTNPYRGFTFGKYFGEPFYSNHINNFIKKLSPVTHFGRTVLHSGVGSQLIYSPPQRKREEMILLCSNFINTLFQKRVNQEKKKIWAEKTPHNILHMKLISELFPNARFICIHRDPRDVVASLLKKPWAPNDVEGAINWLVNVYDRFTENKEQFPNIPLFETSLESMVQNPEKKIDDISNFLGLDRGFDLTGIDLSKSNSGRWKNEIEPEKIDLLHNELDDYIKQYGYK